MKHQKLLVAFAVVLFSFVTLGKNNYVMAKVDETKTQLVRGIKKATIPLMIPKTRKRCLGVPSMDIKMNSLNI